MLSSLPELNWTLVIMLLVVSAVVSFIGDIVGMRIGKKRVSLFGLRPRYTSSLVTVVTGILIMLFTLGALAMTSETVRTAIFSMKIVQSQIRDLTSQLQENRSELDSMEQRLAESQSSLIEKQTQLSEVQSELEGREERLAQVERELEQTRQEQKLTQQELEELREERSRLNRQIEQLRSDAKLLKEGLEELRAGKIVVFAGELMAQTVIVPEESDLSVETLQETLIANARQTVALRMGTQSDLVKIILEDEGFIKERLQKSRDSEERVLLRLIASENAIAGEPVYVEISDYPSKLVYPEGTILADKTLPSDLEDAEAENFLYTVLRQINKKAREDGVLPDPLRGTVGNLEASDFFEAIEKIAGKDEPRRVLVETAEDIYTEGPVRVRIRVLSGG
ncbi:MAG: DUF3084 domain-containing protein [Thermovirgaceae bacterium]